MQAKHSRVLEGTKEIPLGSLELPTGVKALLLRLYSDARPNEGVALAGGCPRDLLHGATPKDVDIALYSMTQYQAEVLINRVLPDLDPRFVRDGGWSTEYADAGEGGIFKGVLSLVGCRGLEGMDVDFNYYDADSLGRVMESFDFTINQVGIAYNWPDPEGGPRLGVYLHKDVTWGVNKEVGSGSRLPERCEKMRAKAAYYGWENV
ncbi:putative nucleotidyl transferase [Pseudomonas phage vB_PaeP_PE3]|uniref:Putative nucleotidyl transferase n=1 Tax=Pseudomonas phage vB_PaeP_PE3 TaxID=2696344 RepID=A0A6C0R1S0_9CAUD|nr:putative nucleotidyl transferase [Pseudomonas phage vB_PaeP_PE3]